MQIKRLAALSLAAILTAAMLTGCDLLAWLAWLEENSDSSSVTSSSSSSSSTSRPSYDDEDDDDDDTGNTGDTGGEDTETPNPNDHTTWTITSDGKLTVTGGSGELTDNVLNDLLEDAGIAKEKLTGLDLSASGYTNLGDGAFQGCTGLTRIQLPDSLTSLGNWAFGDCTGLASVTLPSGLQSIGQYAFYDCDSLTSVTLPGSLTSIGASAFSECTGLTSIDLPDGLTSLKVGTFSGCASLTRVYLPDSLTSIGAFAFMGCTGLTSIQLPDSLTNLGNGAFSGCASLTSIKLPDRLTSIGNDAFRKCTSLTSIHVGTGFLDAEIGMNAFVDVGNPHPDDVTVYYPNGVDVDELKKKLQEAGLKTNYYEPETKMLQAAPAAPNGVKSRPAAVPWLRCPVFAARAKAACKKQTAAPAPPRLPRPLDAARLRSPAGGAKCQPVVHGQVGGKEKPRKTSPYHKLLAKERTCTCLPLRTRINS